MTENKRKFEDNPAVRQRVPVLVGLVGPSGSGKTYSALRLATGIQRAVGGEIGFIDTEARRALHYADKFKFLHLPFGAPFSPLDYLAAIEHFSGKGVKTIVIDSMSHEHEGPGGVLEMHQSNIDKAVAKARERGSTEPEWKMRDRATFLAWAEPKAQRRRLINSILQMDINAVFCFRAKEKIKIVKGEEPKQLGWMPIAGEEFVYEMTVNCLLYPACGGVPVWQPNEDGERQMVKLPAQFRELFSAKKPLDEETGEIMAKWAAGDGSATPHGDSKKERIAKVNAMSDAIKATGAANVAKWLTDHAGRDIKKPGDLTDSEVEKFTALARVELESANSNSGSFGEPGSEG